MSIFRRVMFDMCIRQEYRSFITDVYTNMDWSLFPDPRLKSGRFKDRERKLLFSPDPCDGESTWDESTGRLRLNIGCEYDGNIHDFDIILRNYMEYLPDYCEADKICFYSIHDDNIGVSSNIIYDLKGRRRAELDYIVDKLCDDIYDYAKLSDEWRELHEESIPTQWVPYQSIYDLTDQYVIKNGYALTRATKKDLQEQAENGNMRLISLDELIDENGTLDIPHYITDIYPHTFQNCSKLKRLIIRNKNLYIRYEAFLSCTELEEIIFTEESSPDIWVDPMVFSGCLKLKKVQLPKGMQRIYSDMFYGCINLVEVIIPEDADEHTHIDTSNSVSNENDTEQSDNSSGMIVIMSGAFSLCRSLKKIDLPDSIYFIGARAFSHCTALQEIKLPSSLREIGDEAFNGCILFSSVDIPQGTTEIGEGAFNNCRNLKEITVPDSVVAIGGSTSVDRNILLALSGRIIHNKVLLQSESGCGYEYTPIEGVTIKCYKKSAAEYHAMYNNLRYELIDKEDG